MPGWYCYAADESIHTGEDMKVSDRPPQSPLTASSTPPSSTKCRTSGARSRIAASARSTGTGQPSSPTWMRAYRFLNWRATPRGCSSGRNRARNAACSTSYYRTWLGREDSNLRMAESKSAALPLGDAAVAEPVCYFKRPLAALIPSGFVTPDQPANILRKALSTARAVRGLGTR
jgi:hypothetical protein